MNLKTFFEKFDLFADAPDAVAKMRELVLELAMRGKLVEREEGIHHEGHEEHEGEGIHHEVHEEHEGEVDGDGVPFSVPGGWKWATLSDAANCRAAEKVSPKTILDNSWILDLEDIDGNAGTISQIISFSDRRSLSTKAAFRRGDVLYGKLRPYLNKVVIAPHPGYCTTEIIPLRPSRSIISGFLRVYLRSPTFLRYAAKKNYGMKMPRLGTKDLESAPIPLPPLAEQKRIVAKVDELMALCDRLEAQQQERETKKAALARASLARFADAPTPANLNLLFYPPSCASCPSWCNPSSPSSFIIQPADLRKSILTLAVQGKLVPQDPNDEPAEELLVKLKSERRSFAEAHRFRAPVGEPVDNSSVPFVIPPSWKWCRLSSLFNAVTDGDHLPPPKSDEGTAFLTIGNITTGTLVFEGCRFVPDSYYRGLADFRQPIRGDILYTVVGATFGRPALVDTDRPFCVQRHIAILKPPQSVDVGFLMAVLRSPLAYDQASASTTGTAQPTIPLGSLRNFVAPLPPLAEQRRIVAKVEQLMALVDALETQLATARAAAANLLAALVAELTAGKVPLEHTHVEDILELMTY